MNLTTSEVLQPIIFVNNIIRKYGINNILSTHAINVTRFTCNVRNAVVYKTLLM